jgi:hypothetical protein
MARYSSGPICWDIEKSCWPLDRTFKRFRDRFTIEIDTMVEDLVDGPPLNDELDD